MTGYERFSRCLAGSVTVVVAVLLFLHLSIVSAYGSGTGETIAGVIAGGVVLLILIAMWTVARPSNSLVRAVLCLAMFVGHVALFVLID